MVQWAENHGFGYWVWVEEDWVAVCWFGVLSGPWDWAHYQLEQ